MYHNIITQDAERHFIVLLTSKKKQPVLSKLLPVQRLRQFVAVNRTIYRQKKEIAAIYESSILLRPISVILLPKRNL